MNRLPVFALALFLSSGWWGDIVRATATALGLNAPAVAEDQAPPPPPDPTTNAGSEWDPWGNPRGG
jgi:hypothetical protein